MSNWLSPENKLMSAVNRVIDALVIGTLWFICCIPIITVGASSTAFYYAYNKSIRQRRGYAYKEFFSAFKSNFKQATIMWLFVIGLYLITALDVYILANQPEPTSYSQILLMIILVIICGITVWVLFMFPYLARFANTTRVMLKNSLLITAGNLLWGIVLLILAAAMAFVFIILPFAMFIAPAIYMWFANRIQERIFRKYMTEEERLRQDELEKME
jgi:uncharacterized membrane protein YesL